MKLRTIAKHAAKHAALVSALVLGAQSPAMAHKAVHVGGTLYVIICDPGGEAFTFNGTAQGATEIGGLLCPSGAIITGGGTGVGTAAGAALDMNTFQVIEAKPARAALAAKTKPTPTVKECPKGTHWYEPAKACVANGGHPSL